MDNIKSQDEYEIIAALVQDVQSVHGLVFNTRALKNTLSKVRSRIRKEGLSFLTKTLPRLGKAFDKAIAGGDALNAIDYGFKPAIDSKLPRFLGELFQCVLTKDGTLLPNPDATCVKSIRQILFVFYKYELPYTDEQVQQVLQRFEKTEEDLSTTAAALDRLGLDVAAATSTRRTRFKARSLIQVAREAKIVLSNVFSLFDPLDITPRHGPGAVATKQKLWDKYLWSNVSSRITDVYPLDAYFYASAGAVCDRYDSFKAITEVDLPARVLLVPKDSRGPRLISCEPVDFQWIQQGLGRAIVQRVESHPITKSNVFFTDQGPNQRGALLGSKYGRYATLDLNEASDRVTLSLVRLLFPSHLQKYLEACRSTSTELPNKKVLPLIKFAPMGSCLCFPILALSVWALLYAGAPDADTREGILVYGDDVVVPTAYAENAMKLLESFGLKVNQDKSCTKGLFRESCGTDAFQGVNVTPVRLRTVWASSRSPEVYTSWIAYANSFYDRRYYRTYDKIVGMLLKVYPSIPNEDQNPSGPYLREVPDTATKVKRRFHKGLQKVQYRVLVSHSPSIRHTMGGWDMLLRYFTEGSSPSSPSSPPLGRDSKAVRDFEQDILTRRPFSVRTYTSRGTSILVHRWR